jgi:hypothetical protein
MGVYAGPTDSWIDLSFSNSLNGLVKNGLVLALDAGRTLSYPGSGTTWTDLSGLGNNGSLINGVSYTSSDGSSLVFDGVDDYVGFSGSSDFNFASNNFSVETVVFFDSSTSTDNTYRWIYTFGSGDTYFSIVKWRSGLGNGLVVDYSVSGNRYTITTSNVIPSPNVANTVTSPLYDVTNKWSHIIVSVVSNVMTLYINGVSLGSVSLGSRWNSNLPLEIGRFESTDYMKGKIPLLRVYNNKGFTASEVQQNYEATKSRFGL